MNKQINKKEVFAFLKKYGYILVLSVTLLAVAIVLAVTVNNSDNSKVPTDVAPLTMYSPIMNATVAKGYSDTTLKYNSTLKQWEAHKAVTFAVGANADVFAALNGTVKEVYSNYLEGTVVVLEHGNNLKTVYGSLAENVKVKVGDLVTKGDVIGVASNTANSEYNLGTHLRFELLENGISVDPSSYLNLSNK